MPEKFLENRGACHQNKNTGRMLPCYLPKITYESAVWWSKGQQKLAHAKVTGIQRRALREKCLSPQQQLRRLFGVYLLLKSEIRWATYTICNPADNLPLAHQVTERYQKLLPGNALKLCKTFSTIVKPRAGEVYSISLDNLTTIFQAVVHAIGSRAGILEMQQAIRKSMTLNVTTQKRSATVLRHYTLCRQIERIQFR